MGIYIVKLHVEELTRSDIDCRSFDNLEKCYALVSVALVSVTLF